MKNVADNTKFERAIDKTKIPVCQILGVDIAAINMEELLEFIFEYLRELSGDYMTVANVHTTVMAHKDQSYRMVQNSGIMAIPDGGPLSTLGRKRGCKNMERIAGPDFMENVFKNSIQLKYKHFFYGSSTETLHKMRERLIQLYPGLLIVGMYSPPYRPLDEKEDADIIEMLNEADADFIWVGLGAPKQEKWMADHQGKVKGLMVGVGAGFDYFAGNIKRAPKWMQKNNLEWFYRLIQEPGRLFSRYLYTNITFIFEAVIKGK